MNLLNRYLRSLCTEGRVRENKETGQKRHWLSWFEYWHILIKRHEKLIAKYSKTIYPEELYSTICARKLPLSESCKKRVESNCRSCVHFEHNSKNSNRYGHINFDMEGTEIAFQCWISILEDPRSNLDTSGDMPLFLKKKDVPSFLKNK